MNYHTRKLINESCLTDLKFLPISRAFGIGIPQMVEILRGNHNNSNMIFFFDNKDY
jgi:hypothetical protein